MKLVGIAILFIQTAFLYTNKFLWKVFEKS